jgi:hypothetical protein
MAKAHQKIAATIKILLQLEKREVNLAPSALSHGEYFQLLRLPLFNKSLFSELFSNTIKNYHAKFISDPKTEKNL